MPESLQNLDQHLKRIKAQGAMHPADSMAIQHALRQLDTLVPRMPSHKTRMRFQGLNPERFSEAEWQVVELIAKGYDTEPIARILGCSVSQVYKLRRSIRHRIGVGVTVSLSQHLRLLLLPADD